MKSYGLVSESYGSASKSDGFGVDLRQGDGRSDLDRGRVARDGADGALVNRGG